MKKLYIIICILYCILGIIHAALTPVFYKLNSLEALWFAGTGLSLVFLGLLNISAIRSNNKLIFDLCIFANIISAVYKTFLTIKICEPQAFIAVVLMALMLFGSIFFRIRLRHV
jgi:hypothetical protein